MKKRSNFKGSKKKLPRVSMPTVTLQMADGSYKDFKFENRGYYQHKSTVIDPTEQLLINYKAKV